MAKKVDSTQQEIVEALRKFGASVLDLHEVGHSAPDLCAGFRGKNWLIEIKSAHGKLSDSQAEWHALWGGQVATIRTAEEAIALLFSDSLTTFS